MTADTTLTRKLLGPDNWGVFHAGVRVGTITRRQLATSKTDWLWSIGFYPPLHTSRWIQGTAATFDDARAAFAEAWPGFRATITEDELQAWRDEEAWTEEKYRRFDAGLPARQGRDG